MVFPGLRETAVSMRELQVRARQPGDAGLLNHWADITLDVAAT